MSLDLFFVKRRTYESTLYIAIPLVLSAFMHLWNPVGFPLVDQDEGHYMRRAMQVLEGLGPQDLGYVHPYDHPYFGQLFLASVLKVIGYPDLLQPKVGDIHSIEMLYFIPRVLMGVLAVVDTFLVYKIAETRYNRKVAFIAATLFAVMPLSWLTRGIYLDSIQLPFLLLSILFAAYYAKKSESYPVAFSFIVDLLCSIYKTGRTYW
jgi:4-amino-4-deoxy-L-arabinose transferase-like glycosyltransferase